LLLTPLLQRQQQQQQQQQQTHEQINAPEVDVWVRDSNSFRYGVKMPVSSTLNDMMKKVRQELGNFQGIFVAFEGKENERTTVAEMLTAKPNNKNEED
jgi:hypothetical protein